MSKTDADSDIVVRRVGVGLGHLLGGLLSLWVALDRPELPPRPSPSRVMFEKVMFSRIVHFPMLVDVLFGWLNMAP